MLSHVLRHPRRLLGVAYVVIALVVSWQRGVVGTEHTTLAIFRQSYVHLAAHQDLYAAYPAEQGNEARDRFKYSPSAAVLFAPLSKVPYGVALLLWNLAGVAVLFFATTRLLSPRRADLALLLLLPETLAAIQSSSSNALVAGLMLLGVGWLVSGRLVRAAGAIAVGAAIKIFPLAVAAVALTRRDRRAFCVALAMAGVLLLLLPLAVVSPSELARQYASWRLIQAGDARDLVFGLSLIRWLRGVWPTDLSNWAYQAIGCLVLLAPLLRRPRRDDTDFRLRLGCSTLVFAVLFNHQTERATLIVAAAGAAVWLVSRPASPPLFATFAIALTGASIVPYAVLWAALQCDLWMDVRPEPVTHSLRLSHGGWRRWRAMRVPDLLGQALIVAALLDLATPGHAMFAWNLWDLARR